MKIGILSLLFVASSLAAQVNNQTTINGVPNQATNYTGVPISQEGSPGYDPTHKNFSFYAGGMYGVINRTLYINTADGTTLANSTATQSIIPATGLGTVTLPANYIVAGRKFDITTSGVFSTDGGTPNITTTVKVGSSTAATVTALNLPNSQSNMQYSIVVKITCRTVVATTATCQISGFVQYTISTGSRTTWDLANSGATFTVATNVANLLDITDAWSAASASNTLTPKSITITEVY